MGLFDKLFGKKNQNAEQKKEPESNYLSVFINSLPSSVPDPEPPVSSVLRPITYKEVETMIAANPLSVTYRRETQQSSTSLNFLPFPDLYTKYKISFVALDLETTGLSETNDSIVEIGAVKVKNGEITEKYNQLVFPNISMPESASAVNHITDDMLIGKPFIFQVLPDFLSFVDHQIIVAHNASFDFKFIAQACMRYKFKIPRRWMDSMELKSFYPEVRSRSLKSLLSAAGMENMEAHRALSDAEALAKLIIFSKDKLPQTEGT